MREIKRLAQDQAHSLMQDYRLNTVTHRHTHTHTHLHPHTRVRICSARRSSAIHEHMQMPAFQRHTLPVLDTGKVRQSHIR